MPAMVSLSCATRHIPRCLAHGPTIVGEAHMYRTPENDPHVERLRAELTRAEEDLRVATTPEAKDQIVDRLRQALANFSCQVNDNPKSAAASG